jgi:cell division control protein 6
MATKRIYPHRAQTFSSGLPALSDGLAQSFLPQRTLVWVCIFCYLLSILSNLCKYLALRRHASTSNLVTSDTPTTSIAQLGLQTPPLTPSVPSPLHIRTRALLRATCNGSAEIAGRIPQRQFIRNFISEFISSRPITNVTKPVLYISGSPGCGKTALVNSILATFEVELLENNVKLVTINCMALNGLEAVWERMIEELGPLDKCGSKTRSCEIVGNLLSNRTSKWSVDKMPYELG